jgi:exosortase
MTRYEKLLLEQKPALCLVVGDVTSTMACSIAAQKLCVKVAHVEAGIRSGDWTMPEEINRMVTDSITNYFFTTSAHANRNLRGAGVGIALLGSLLAVFGMSSIRWLWFPWAYCVVFGQYISERAMSRVTERLQDWSAIGADLLLNTIGIDTDRTGNVLTVHMSDGTMHPLNVAEACSGMRTLMAFLAIGVALAALGLPRWWQRVLLVAAGVPISIFVNVLRVASLGLLSMVDTNFSTGEFHSMVGLVWLVPAFLLFLGAMWLIRNLVVDVEPGAAGGTP